MLKEIDTVKLIFGLKIQQLRRDKGLSYQQLSNLTGLAISYLHNIEKGKKYPKTDKILLLAKALEADYNYLVSLEANKKLKPIIDLLHSDFLKIFPLDDFGIDVSKLIELLSVAPDKVNAFVSTVLKITRNFDMQGEDFYKVALRSYQDLHDNYFEEVEEAANQFRKHNKLKIDQQLDQKTLKKLLRKCFDVALDSEYLDSKPHLSQILSYYSPAKQQLLVRADLADPITKFLLAKEIGFQVLKQTERPLETPLLEVDSFDKLLINFKAAYFAVALILPESVMIEEIERMAQWRKWDNEAFLGLLNRFGAAPGMVLQRLANLLPRHFDIRDIFFIRFFAQPDLKKFLVTKEMHLSQLHDPHANQLDEHYCRRWISINLIRQLKALPNTEAVAGPIAGVQISKYVDTPNAYFCLSIAQPSMTNSDESYSFTIGLLLDDKLRRLFKFLGDTAIKHKEVHTTCERCPISDCAARVFPPVFLQQEQRRERTRQELQQIEEMKSLHNS